MVLDLAKVFARSACLILTALLLLSSCGGTPSGSDSAGPAAVVPPGSDTAGPTIMPESSTPSTASSTTDPREGASTVEWAASAGDVLTVFGGLAKENLGFALLVPSELPQGTRVAEGWRALDGDPTQGTQRNPHLIGAGGEKELRLLLQTDRGFVEIIEGMRGDLGDLPHERVTLTGETTAGLYEVMGGALVQWSRDATWYAVFGKGVPAEDVMRIARGMKVAH